MIASLIKNIGEVDLKEDDYLPLDRDFHYRAGKKECTKS